MPSIHHFFVPTPAVDLPSQSLTQKSHVPRYCNVFTCAHWTILATVCKGPNTLYQKRQFRDTAPTLNANTAQCDRRYGMNQRRPIKTKLVFVSQPPCLCPNSRAMNDGRQMRMTDRDTPHPLNKIKLTSIGPRQPRKRLLQEFSSSLIV